MSAPHGIDSRVKTKLFRDRAAGSRACRLGHGSPLGPEQPGRDAAAIGLDPLAGSSDSSMRGSTDGTGTAA